MVLGEGLPGYRALPSHIGLQHIPPKNKRNIKKIEKSYRNLRLKCSGRFCIVGVEEFNDYGKASTKKNFHNEHQVDGNLICSLC